MMLCWRSQLICPAVHRIAGQPVELPAEDALRLAGFYPPHHVVEYRAAGLLCRLLLGELSDEW